MRERSSIVPKEDDVFDSLIGASERLSMQERLAVAERLLGRPAVGHDYVEDIIHTVADMVPQLPEERRLDFLIKMDRFMTDSRHFKGSDSYRFLTPEFLKSLSPRDLERFSSYLQTEMKPNYVLSCEAHAWGLAVLIPWLGGFHQREAAAAILALASDSSWHDLVKQILVRVTGHITIDKRTDFMFGMVEHLKRNTCKEIKRCIVDSVTTLLSSLPESERILITDAVAPMVFDVDTVIVRKALNFFALNTILLPVSQRYPYALMVSGLLCDVSLGFDVAETLESLLPSLTYEPEKSRIQDLLNRYDTSQNESIINRQISHEESRVFAH